MPVVVPRVPEGAIAAIRPHLDAADRDAPAEVLDQGFGNVAIRLGGTVARIAANPEVARSHLRELQTLPVLRGRLPVAVPAPCRPVPAADALPFGALLHPLLPGRVMEEGDAARHPSLAVEIAGCLVALHSIASTDFGEGSLVDLEPVAELAKVETQTRELRDRRLSPIQHGTFERLLDRARQILPGRDRVVSHGDPWYGNMLLDDEGHLCALVDFEGACLADPAFDLAAQTYLDPPWADVAIESYVDRTHHLEDIHERVRAYLLIRELGGLAYAVRNDMHDEIEHSFADLIGMLA